MSKDLLLDPDKRYFKIGEVSVITGLKPYVLRFWESEFKQIKPGRTLSGQRVYKRSDLNLILTIKNLLYEKKFTISGAKASLAQNDTEDSPASIVSSSISLLEFRDELLAIRRLMD